MLVQQTNYMKKTIDQSIVRNSNLSLVLQSIHNNAPLSRAKLAEMTELNKSTISSLVEDLLARQLIHEIGKDSNKAGRPATLLEVNPRAGGIVGVELGVDFVAVGLMDISGKIIWKHTEDADPSLEQEKTIAQTLTLVDIAIAKCKEMKLRLLGIGLVVPGTVDLQEGVLVYSPNLQWTNVPLGKIFSDHTGLKTFIENDANAAAVAEHLFGAMKHTQDFIFIYAGVGIGGGLFLNGKLYRGRHGYAGEIGHFPVISDVDANGEICLCGNPNCWEIRANQRALIMRGEAILDKNSASIISQVMREHNETSPSVDIMKLAADAGDQDVIHAFAEVGHAMGQGIAGLVNIFNPEKIVFGGTLSMASDYLIPAVISSVENLAQNDIMKRTEVVISTFTNDASLFGAVAIVVQNIMWNPTTVEKEVVFSV